MTPKFKIRPDRSSHKIGVDEVKGLKLAMISALDPATEWLRDKSYWDSRLKPEPTEYKPRDGFIPHSHNQGGMELSLHIPQCEQYEWDFLEFGECDECGKDTKDGEPIQCGYRGEECAAESDGHLDARLRIWLKLESVSETELTFYLYVGGGNADAPYFRVKYEPTLYESEFTAKSMTEVVIKGRAEVRRMIKALENKTVSDRITSASNAKEHV